MVPSSSSLLSQTREILTSRPFSRLRSGVLEGRVDSHTHITGRTDRVVENIEEEVDGGKGGKKDEERIVRGILREAKIVARSKVEWFDLNWYSGTLMLRLPYSRSGVEDTGDN